MHLLAQYCEYARMGDFSKIASLFTEDAVFYDEGPTTVGQPAIDIKGRPAIEDLFKRVFAQGGFDISNVVINENAMRYDVQYGDTPILLLGVMKGEGELIKEYRITV